MENQIGKIIKTENLLNNFCGGCNNAVVLKKFVQVDEGQSFKEAWKQKFENEGDEFFKRMRFMGFCLCGNIYIYGKSKSQS